MILTSSMRKATTDREAKNLAQKRACLKKVHALLLNHDLINEDGTIDSLTPSQKIKWMQDDPSTWSSKRINDAFDVLKKSYT